MLEKSACTRVEEQGLLVIVESVLTVVECVTRPVTAVMGQTRLSPAAPPPASPPPWGQCASLVMGITTQGWSAGGVAREDTLATGVIMGPVYTGGRSVMEGHS